MAAADVGNRPQLANLFGKSVKQCPIQGLAGQFICDPCGIFGGDSIIAP
jgi:hypothetical protein